MNHLHISYAVPNHRRSHPARQFALGLVSGLALSALILLIIAVSIP